MPRLYPGKRIIALLLPQGHLNGRRNNFLILFISTCTCLAGFIYYKNLAAIGGLALQEWLTLASVFSSLFLAYLLFRSEQRRRGAETISKAHQLKFEKLYHSGIIGLWLTGGDGQVSQANDAFLEMIGYSRADLEAGLINWKELTAPEYVEVTGERLAELQETGRCLPYEKEYIRKDGQRVRVMLGSALVPEDGQDRIMAYALDLSGTKRAEESQRRQQEDLLRIFMEAPACIVIRKGPELKVEFINHAAIAHSGLARQHVQGATTAAYFAKVTTTFDSGILKQVYETGVPFKQKAYHLRYDRYGDGSLVDAWYDIVMEPTRSGDGEIDGVATYTFEVSDFVQANKELQVSETRFRFIADAIPHKMWTSAADGSATYYNQGWHDYAGTSELEELRSKIWSLIHPDDLEDANTRWKGAVENGTDLEMEQRLLRHDGQYFWHLSRVCVHKDDSGNVKLWVGTSTNIHAQKMAQERIAASETYFKVLANNNSLLIWQTDAEGETVFVNDTWRAYTGITQDSTDSAYWVNNIHPDDRAQAILDFKTANVGKLPYQSKYRFKDARSGEYRWMLDSVQPLFDPAFSGYIGGITDIHEQEVAKLAMEELAKRKDDFFTVASHELKTPITTIKASLQIIQSMLNQDPGAKNTLSFINKASKQATRLTSIVNDLLDFNRIQSGKLELRTEPYLLGESILECIGELRLQYPDRSIVVSEAPDALVLGDRARIAQVIFNLLINAIKYSAKGQQIIVTLQKEGAELKCCIIDQGIGIPKDKQPYVFDRFFRVHEDSQNYTGLGMGLYICADIIKRHGGAIGVVSEESAGSTFWFTLPLSMSV